MNPAIFKRLVREANRVEVEVVFLGFDEEEKMLPGIAKPILDARWHMVGLMPDDVVAKNPAPISHRNCKSCRNLAERTPNDRLLVRRRGMKQRVRVPNVFVIAVGLISAVIPRDYITVSVASMEGAKGFYIVDHCCPMISTDNL